MIIARLVRQADRYVAVEPRVVTPPQPSGPGDADATRWENVAQLWELKTCADGGRSILIVGEPYTNADVVKLDLATGRTRDRFAITAWLPPVRGYVGLPMGVALANLYVSSWPGFQCDLAPWLLPGTGDDIGRLIGQPLDVYADNLTAGNNLSGHSFWHSDSTQVLLQEKLRTLVPPGASRGVTQKGLTPNRIAIARIERRPGAALPVAPSTVGPWAPTPAECRGAFAGDVEVRHTDRNDIVTVTADVYGDVRPVQNATVTVGTLVVKTNAVGEAMLPLSRNGERAVAVTASDMFVRAEITR